MKNAYTILTPARAGDWGSCLLVSDLLGEIIEGKSPFESLPKDLLEQLKEGNPNSTTEDLEEELSHQNEDVYYFITNNLLESHNHFVSFHNIAQLAQYVLEHNVNVIDDIRY